MRADLWNHQLLAYWIKLTISEVSAAKRSALLCAEHQSLTVKGSWSEIRQDPHSFCTQRHRADARTGHYRVGFRVPCLFAFPVYVLPLIQARVVAGSVGWPVLWEAIKEPGAERASVKGPVDFVLLLVALLVPVRSSSPNDSDGASPSKLSNWRNISITLIDRILPPVPGSMSVMAFHEKAGRSQVDSCLASLDKVFCPAEWPLSPCFH
ncbi:MAG: hypothetical protein WB510_11405, partial [Candidatus Sulfotelmatobacter sp.]